MEPMFLRDVETAERLGMGETRPERGHPAFENAESLPI
jgi:hypothetical protein